MRSGNWTVSIVGNEWWIKGYYQNWLHLSSGIKCEVHHGKHANITDLNQQSQWLTNQCHVTIHTCQTAYANHALQTFLTLPLLLLLLLNWLRKKHTIQPIIIKLDKTINLMFAQKCCQSPTFFQCDLSLCWYKNCTGSTNEGVHQVSVRSVEQLQATMVGQPDFDFNSWGLKN